MCVRVSAHVTSCGRVQPLHWQPNQGSVPKLSEATLRTQSMSGASGKTSKDKPKLVERYVSHKRLQAAHRVRTSGVSTIRVPNGDPCLHEVTLAFGKLSTLMLPTGRCPARLERLPTDLRHGCIDDRHVSRCLSRSGSCMPRIPGCGISCSERDSLLSSSRQLPMGAAN